MANNAPIPRARSSALSHGSQSANGAVPNVPSPTGRKMAKDAPIDPTRDHRRRPDPPTSEPQMPRLQFPNRLERGKARQQNRPECPAHRAWVRKHHCCVPGCLRRPIECAHVRHDTDGGMALKPSDRWTISLCRDHQHRLGEIVFEQKYDMDMRALADEFVRRSPHRLKL